MAAQHGAEALIRAALGAKPAEEDLINDVALLAEYFPHVEHCINATSKIDGPGSLASEDTSVCAICGVAGKEGDLIVSDGYGEHRVDTVAIHPGCGLLEVSRMTAMWCFHHAVGDTEGTVVFRIPVRHPTLPLADHIVEGLIVNTDKRLGTQRLIHRVDFVLADGNTAWDTDLHIDMAEVTKVYQRSVLGNSEE